MKPQLVRMSSLNHKLVTISVMLATIMQTLDATIANVALPHMRGTFSATQDEIIWVLTSYIVASAIATPLMGWLATCYGRKEIFLISIVGFVVSSALCGASETLFQIVFFRVVQGVCGAAFVPLSQALLLDINEPKNFGKAMALWGIGVTIGPILGPLLGGWLTDTYTWRWVFYINVPVGVLAFFGLFFTMPNTQKQEHYFDFFGFIVLSLGVGALQLMLDRGTLQDWFGSREIILEAMIAGTGFYLFIVHTLTYRQPFVSSELFLNKNFVISNTLIFIIGVILFGTLALLPPMLQQEMSYPVVTTGFVTAPRGIGAMVSMIVVGRLVGKIDARLIMTVGFLLVAFSLWQMTQYSLMMDEKPVIVSGLVQGFGIGLCYVPLSSVAFSTLSSHLRDEGTAFFSLVRNIGSSIGISFAQVLLVRNIQIAHSSLVAHITPYNLKNSAFRANPVDVTSEAGLLKLNDFITNQGVMVAYIDNFKFMMIMTLLSLPLLFLLKQPKEPLLKGATARG